MIFAEPIDYDKNREVILELITPDPSNAFDMTCQMFENQYPQAVIPLSLGIFGRKAVTKAGEELIEHSGSINRALKGIDNLEYHLGDRTPGGRVFTKHGAEQASERGFTTKVIDSIIDNNKKTRVKEIDLETGKTQWRYQDKRGNTVITDEYGKNIVTTYSHPKTSNGGSYIPKK